MAAECCPPPRPHPTPGPPQAQGTCMLSEPSRLRFLCPYPLRFLPRVLRNHRTPSCLQEATRQGGSSRKKKKKKKKSKERRKTNKRAFPFSWCPAALQVGDQAVPAPPLSAPALRCSRREHRLAESWVWTGQAARAALLLCLPGGGGRRTWEKQPDTPSNTHAPTPTHTGLPLLPWDPPEGQGPAMVTPEPRLSVPRPWAAWRGSGLGTDAPGSAR